MNDFDFAEDYAADLADLHADEREEVLEAMADEWPGDDTSEYDDDYVDYGGEAMDGDHDTAMRDAGWGTDEDYGLYSDEYEPDCDLYGEY